MTVELLNTGSELLLGEVVNTSAAWLGKQIFPLGLRLSRQTTLPDGPAIRQGLIEAAVRCDVLFVTGGLGPTTDDITREVTAELCARPLRSDASVRASIEQRLAARGIPLRERMLRQTMVPEGATVLPNANGTAPGLYIPAAPHVAGGLPHIFLLPGPPRELQPMFANHALPILREIAGGIEARECRIYRVVGIGESEVEERIGLSLEKDGRFEVGYCARPSEVDFRLIGRPGDLDAVEPSVLAAVGTHLVSTSGEDLETWIVGALARRKLTVATAESCTGGLVANRITNVPGSSDVFREGFVTYSNEAKARLLGVHPALIKKHGAVSEPVAAAMAAGACERANADFALSLTGIAGPGGGTPKKPVGLVFIGLAQRGGETQVSRCNFPSDRLTFKQLASQRALDLLRRRLLTD